MYHCITCLIINVELNKTIFYYPDIETKYHDLLSRSDKISVTKYIKILLAISDKIQRLRKYYGHIKYYTRSKNTIPND